MKSHPVEAELFHAEGRADMMKLTVAFRNFANAPKNSCHGVNHALQANLLFILPLRRCILL